MDVNYGEGILDTNVAEDFRAKIRAAIEPFVLSGGDKDAIANSLFEIMQQIAAAEVSEYAQRDAANADRAKSK